MTTKSSNKKIAQVATYTFLFMTLTKNQMLKGIAPVKEEEKQPVQNEISSREKLRTRYAESKHNHLRVFEEQTRPNKATMNSAQQPQRHSFRHR